MSEWKSSACILCECNCGIEVQLGGADGRRLVKVRGDDAHPASRGYACEKPSRLDFYQNGPHRLTKPLRRRADGTFEEIDWDTAIREVAARFAAIRDEHGGESIFYYGGGGQGNHLPGLYGPATRSLLGSVHSANAISQEKTGEFWVAKKMVGGFSRGNFEHCEVGLFLGKNPWLSHGIPRARVTLREIAKDPKRCLIVIDPRRTETADFADIHLQVKPGGDAFLLAAMIAVIVQEGLVKREWLAKHADGFEEVLPHFTSLDVGAHAARSGVPEEQLRSAARRIAAAESMATFEDLGVQMNLHSTLVSYLHKLLVLLTGNFGKKGAEYRPTTLVPQAFNGEECGTTPVTGSKIIGGLTPCNVVPEEILTDHPKRFRAMLVESENPAHSIADGVRMREALAALDLVVVIDVAFTETARLAEALGALPKDAVEALREAWLESRVAFRTKFFELITANKRLAAIAPVLVYRAIGDLLPEGLAEGAGVWVTFQRAAPRIAPSLARAGFTGSPPEAADALFDALLASKSAITFSVDDWEESFARVATPNGRIQLAVPELFAELDALAREPERVSAEFPLVLSAGERRSFTANTIIRNPEWRRKDRAGSLRMHPDDAKRAGVADGGRVRLSTRRGSSEVSVEISDRMHPGHISLPNGLGLDFPDASGGRVATGVSPNELTRSEDRDWVAGTPWHKHTPARVEAL